MNPTDIAAARTAHLAPPVKPPGPRGTLRRNPNTANTGCGLALLGLAVFWGLVGLVLTTFNGSAR